MKQRESMHKYQTTAVDFICRKKKCGLFLFLGAGKTIISLTAISDLLDACVIKRVLVIAPLRVANSVWAQEAAAWEHLRHIKVSVCTGTAKAREAALRASADVYVINRENVPWLVGLCGKKWPYDAVVIDEASSFKNPSAIRFRKLKKPSQLSHVFILLTGTPAPNGLMDLWSPAYLMDGGETLGRTITGYRKRFFDADYFGHSWTPKEGVAETIHNLLKPKVLSMTADDHLNMPERIDLTVSVHMPAPVMIEYKRFKRDLVVELAVASQNNVETHISHESLSSPENSEIVNRTVEAASTAVLAGKLLQWANGAIYTGEGKNFIEIHSAKLDALADVIEDNAGENIIVPYNFKSDLARLKKKFPQGVALDTNNETIDRWNNKEIPLLFAHPASCGHGVNLQHGGSMIVWFALNWSLELDQQMNARLHRQGQTKPVRIVRIVTEGTFDNRVLNVLKSKDGTQSALINALKKELIQ